MKPTKRRLVAGAFALLFGLGAAIALAQPNPAPQPRPVQPRPLQPGQARPGQPPNGQPQLPPGFPGGRPPTPGMPGQRPTPGGRPMPGQKPRPRVAPPEAEEPSHAELECPGEGPEDPPPPPNWWRGLLMVNNERAEAGGFMNHLLFRYENEHDKCDPKNEPPPFLAAMLNLGIFAFVVGRFGKKPLAEALRKRRADIMGEIDNATRLKEEAEARLADYEERFENIHATLEQIRADYAAESEREREHILAEAEERRARMQRDAQFRIEQELKAARQQLLQDAVLGAVGAAEEVLVSRVNASDQDRMAEAFLASLGPALRGGMTGPAGGRETSKGGAA